MQGIASRPMIDMVLRTQPIRSLRFSQEGAIRMTMLFILLSMMLFTISPASGETPADTQQPDRAATVLITGSNRGIGFEFARQYAQKGWVVLATARRPGGADDLKALAAEYPNVKIERLDVTDPATIEALAEKYRDHPIDVLINNAGVLGDPAVQTLQDLEYETFTQVMAVNVFGALAVSQAFLEQVGASDQKKIVTITSSMGSMTLTRSGNFYFYRISKAGVNMAMRTLQADVRDRGIIVAMLMPGAVATRMLAQTGYRGPALSPEESVSRLIKVIINLSPEQAGTFLQYDGKTLPW
jgi:NAD(P)-dependent dehydrogenase (short-subunit alcohol dehydrogenase family)